MSPHEDVVPLQPKAERRAGAALMTLGNVLPKSWRQREGMIENRPVLTVLRHLILIVGIAIVAFPIYVTFVASSLTAEQVLESPMQLYPGGRLIENYLTVLTQGSGMGSSAPVGQMMINSLITALIIVFGKITISILSAFAIVYFRFPMRMLFFWMIFVTLMLPVEVRILPTYKVVSDLGMINTYAGLTVPLIASATATFLFRQFFLTIPDELVEAARIDGAGRWGVLRHVTLPALTPVTIFLLLFQTINALQVFDLVFVTTKGGPLGSTTVIVYFIWEKAFKTFTAGYSAAAAYTLAVALLVIGVALQLYRKRVAGR